MDLLPLLAGLGLFMLGMKQLEEAIAALAGVTFRRFVRDHASTPMRGLATPLRRQASWVRRTVRRTRERLSRRGTSASAS